MNLTIAAPLWLIGVLACALIAAATEDAIRYRISNVTSLVVLVSAVAAMVLEGPSWELWQNAAVFVAILLLGTVAFSAGLLGGGDAKLFAATALWLDVRSAVWFVVFTFLAGGVVAIFYLATRSFRRKVTAKANDRRVPYGVAIAVGALALLLIDRGAFQHHDRPLSSYRLHPST